MSWSVNVFLLFFFVYTTKGIPLDGIPERHVKLSASIIPTQWRKDSEVSHHWPKGEVSYVFDDKSYDDGVKDRVRIAMAALERDTCIRFKEQKGDGGGSWLHFTNPGKQRHCAHDPSYQENGEIQMTLGYDCLRQRDIMHSVLHGVGFRDEISHPQRDLFVKIMWGNIQSGYKPLFRIQMVNNAGGLVEYDPMSIMHFHDRAYSLNGQATITALLPGLKIAPSEELSHLDKMKLGIMFGHECNKRKVGEVLNKCKGILMEYGEKELTTTKPEDDDDDDEGGNNEVNQNESKEKVIVGNDVNNTQEEDPIASDNNKESQKENGDESQEVIVEGNGVVSEIASNEDVVDNDQTENPENVDSTDDNENKNTIENIDVAPDQELIVVGDGEEGENVANGNNVNDNSKNAMETDESAVVGNDNKGGDDSDDNNRDNRGDEEIIIVGNEKKGEDDPVDNNLDNKEDEETIIVGHENKGGDSPDDNNHDNKGGDEKIIVGRDN